MSCPRAIARQFLPWLSLCILIASVTLSARSFCVATYVQHESASYSSAEDRLEINYRNVGLTEGLFHYHGQHRVIQSYSDWLPPPGPNILGFSRIVDYDVSSGTARKINAAESLLNLPIRQSRNLRVVLTGFSYTSSQLTAGRNESSEHSDLFIPVWPVGLMLVLITARQLQKRQRQRNLRGFPVELEPRKIA